jgi:lipoyl(octanoyl) transferase
MPTFQQRLENSNPTFLIEDLGSGLPYEKTWKAMQEYTQLRNADSHDKIWLLEHNPIYTLGLAGKASHLLQPNGIELLRCDRGGQITYHGPGQLMVYFLCDLKRLQIKIHDWITLLETLMIHFLATLNITAFANPKARGIYIKGKKIASIGLKISKGCCYHGLALNVSLDLSPFDAITPCGIQDLSMCKLQDFLPNMSIDEVKLQLRNYIIQFLQKTYSELDPTL